MPDCMIPHCLSLYIGTYQSKSHLIVWQNNVEKIESLMRSLWFSFIVYTVYSILKSPSWEQQNPLPRSQNLPLENSKIHCPEVKIFLLKLENGWWACNGKEYVPQMDSMVHERHIDTKHLWCLLQWHQLDDDLPGTEIIYKQVSWIDISRLIGSGWTNFNQRATTLWCYWVDPHEKCMCTTTLWWHIPYLFLRSGSGRTTLWSFNIEGNHSYVTGPLPMKVTCAQQHCGDIKLHNIPPFGFTNMFCLCLGFNVARIV